MKINDDGFTLIELIAVIIVLGILAGFTVSFLDHAVRNYTLVKEQQDIYTDGAYVMERIVRELSDAFEVTEPASGLTSSNIKFTVPAHGPRPETTIEFKQDNINPRNLLRNGVPIATNLNAASTDYGFRVTREAVVPGTQASTITVELQLTSANDSNNIPPFKLVTKVVPNNYNIDNYTQRSFNKGYYEQINE